MPKKEETSAAAPAGAGEEHISISKNTLMVLIIGVLALLLIASIFTGGFGLAGKSGLTGTGSSGISGSGDTGGAAGTAPGSAPSPSSAAIPTALTNVQIDGGSLPALGEGSAPVTLIEFSDFQCPFCGRHFDQTGGSIQQGYIDTGKVKFYYRDYPLLQLGHLNADDTALAARCANDELKFWEYHNILFENQQAWSNLGDDEITTTLVGYAEDLGLDTATFESCLTSRQHEDAVEQDILEGQQAYGGPLGTPTFFILIPKDKTTRDQLETVLGGPYARNLGLAQSGDNYVVMVTGALPYTVFKGIFDTVTY